MKNLYDFFCKKSLRKSGEEDNNRDSVTSDSESDRGSNDGTSTGNGDLNIKLGSTDSHTEDAHVASDEEDKPLFQGSRLTYCEHMLSVIAYAKKHNLNLTQTIDLLELTTIHTARNCKTECSVNNLKINLTGQISLIYHDMCESCNCYRLFPIEASCAVCKTKDCMSEICNFK